MTSVGWVVTRDGVHVHTGPTGGGCAHVRLALPDESVALPNRSAVAVAALVGD